MAEYISTFITGFKDVVINKITSDLKHIKVISIYDGLIYYRYDGNYNNIKKIMYFNNTFYVMRAFRKRNLTFEQMVSKTCNLRTHLIISSGTFRVRFSKENIFYKVDSKIVKRVEKHISSIGHIKVNRVNPSTEIWFIIRAEEIGFYCQLLFKRDFTEKKLKHGELRPELVFLICNCLKLTDKTVICDPFCGYGAIPKQLIASFNVKEVIASDINKKIINELYSENWTKRKKLSLNVANATNLFMIKDNYVDFVITDPPWGFYEKIQDIKGFYFEILRELIRITKKEGTIVFISARKDEVDEVCRINNITIYRQINTLVNGKKASIFFIKAI